MHAVHMVPSPSENYYRQNFNIIRALIGNKIVDHSDVVDAVCQYLEIKRIQPCVQSPQFHVLLCLWNRIVFPNYQLY